MKKILALVLALAMALSLAGALAAPGDAVLGRGEDGAQDTYYNRVFAENGTLYMSSYDTLASYHIGDGAETAYQVVFPDYQPADENTGYNWHATYFGCDGAVYAVAILSEYSDHTSFVRASLCEVSFEGEGEEAAARLTEKLELDWDDMIEYYDQESYARDPESILGFGGYGYMIAYDSSYIQQVYKMDLQTGTMEPLYDLGEVYAMTTYRDGTLLTESAEYVGTGYRVTLRVYDPSTGRTEDVLETILEDYNPYSALAYDPQTDCVYCVKSGEVCPLDVRTGEVGKGVADAPMDTYSNSAACVMDGYFAYAGGGVCVRNLDVSLRGETRIKVVDGSYSDVVQTANYVFTNAHGDVSVAISHDYGETQNLVENMMNRDDSVDIYIVSTSSEAYDAVYTRGYMMELDSSPALSALADSMYPDLREALSVNGRFVAVPVSVYAHALGVNERALEMLGMTPEDVPDNWDDMLDFIDALPEKIGDNKRVSLFYENSTIEDARRTLFYPVFEDYQKYVNCTDPSMGYDTPMLRGLLEKLERIDFSRFGMEHEEPRDEEGPVVGGGVVYDYGYDDGQRVYQLFETGVGCSFGNFWGWGEQTPVLMSMTADTPHYLVLDMSIAFINPFTKHPQEAMMFMEQLADSMQNTVRYDIDPSQNETIRSSYYEEWKKQLEEYHDQLLRELEKADEADRQMMEESLREFDQNAQMMEDNSWEIGPRDLEWYRSHDDHLRLAGVNWIYSEASGGEAASLVYQYLEGSIDYRAMLAGIDKKVRMMIMEGR